MYYDIIKRTIKVKVANMKQSCLNQILLFVKKKQINCEEAKQNVTILTFIYPYYKENHVFI